jgi:hypothetical protein
MPTFGETTVFNCLENVVSPYINRFLSPDTIVPGMSNPQNLNRYMYVLGNPLKYTDPTGHASICMDGGDVCYDQEKRQWRGDIDWGLWGPHKPKSKPKPSPSDEDECTTVTCNAVNGDLAAVADLLIPTHGGARLQLEGSFWVFSVSGGVNMIYNRNDHHLGANLDFTGEISPGLSLGAGASLTVGPLIGWGSSSVDDVISGNSVIVSGAAAYEGAATGAVSAPLTGIDPYYGQIPATVYFGVGVGGAYAGLSGGLTHSFFSGSIPLP